MKEIIYYLLLLTALRMQYVVCSQFYIVVSSDTPCPSRLPCLSLQQFISNPSLSSASTILELESGNHVLDTDFEVSGGTYFAMTSTANASVICRSSNSIRVRHVQQVKINGTTFFGCKTVEVSYAMNAVIVRNHFYNSNGTYAMKISSTSERALVESCKFLNNIGGPAIYVNGGSAMILNSTFSNNNNSGSGTVFATGSLYVNQSIFINNTAKYGGAIYCRGTLVTEHCNFYHNVAKSGGALYGRRHIQIIGNVFVDNRATSGNGGAVYVTTNYPSAIASGNSFLNNKANKSGGALYLSGNYPKLHSNGNSFVNNQATYGSGGALYLSGNYPFVNTSGNSFISNKANASGGAIYMSGNYPSQNASGNSFIDNKSTKRGDDLYMVGNYVSLNASGNSFIGMNTSRSGGTWYLSGSHVTSNASGNSFVSNNNISYVNKSNISYGPGIESSDLTGAPCIQSNTLSTHRETMTTKPEYNCICSQTVEPQTESESDLLELQNKLVEISIIMYIFVAISIVLAALLGIVLLVKLYGVIRQKQRKYPQQSDQLPCNASTQAIEEIPWRGHLVHTNTTIQMMPNIVYGKHCI